MTASVPAKVATGGGTFDGPVTLAGAMLGLSILWTLFLVYDVQHRPNPPPLVSSLRLLFHAIPALFLFVTAMTAAKWMMVE